MGSINNSRTIPNTISSSCNNSSIMHKALNTGQTQIRWCIKKANITKLLMINMDTKPQLTINMVYLKSNEYFIDPNYQNYYYQQEGYQYDQTQAQFQEPEVQQLAQEESNTLMLSNIPSEVNQKQIEAFFKTACLQMGTSMYESVRMIGALKMAYVVFPTMNSSRIIYKMLNGSMSLNGKDKIEVTYTPNTMRTERQEATERAGGQAAMFGQGLSFYDPETKSYITGNQETIVHEDWLCESNYQCQNRTSHQTKVNITAYCFYSITSSCSILQRGFLNRGTTTSSILTSCIPSVFSNYWTKLHISKYNYNILCSLLDFNQNAAPIAGQPTQTLQNAQFELPNSSLMLIDAFQQFAQVKDVRMIKEKHDAHHNMSSSGPSSAPQNKDFAFVEFFSVEDATMVLEQAKHEKLRIKGQLVYLSYSKFKRHEQYFESFFDSSQGINNGNTIAGGNATKLFQQEIIPEVVKFEQDNQNSAVTNITINIIQSLNKVSLGSIEKTDQQKEAENQSNLALIEREKAENQLKRWENQQQKLEKLNKQLMSIDKNLVIMPDEPVAFEQAQIIENKSLLQEELKEDLIKEKLKRDVIKHSTYEVHICQPCKRLFRTFNTLLKHQQDSLLHIKLSQKKARDENQQRIKESMRKESQQAEDSNIDKMADSAGKRKDRESFHHYDEKEDKDRKRQRTN
ncbi:rna binding motif protein [Stylonychia lemnae]|uniref:Rna binding motif protein n=1 Tax=Stylonychia lemnae TaxID=5949 RepID=A0A078AUW4_STYLE|nr:rna binding motif protein [Stylonychia lemnae]|eukprot:CDW85037.1 rna binding motif protein [Stylonychia lemnae]